MIEFLDRKEERSRVSRLLDNPEGALCCLYGRRRCGKTRLLQECAKGRKNVVYHLADKADRSAQIARLVRDVSLITPAFRAAEGNDWGTVLDLWMGLAPHGSILILDEFPYLVQRDESLPSVLQRICDVLPDSGNKIVICGSSQRMMQGFVLKQSEPLYGRAREILHIAPLTFEWMCAAFPKWSQFDRLKAWGVWGGVPRYWEFQSEDEDLWQCVRRNVCSPLGVLRNEPQFLLLDDCGDVAQAATVLSFIGGGAHRVAEVASRMGKQVTDMPRPLKRLSDLGLIAKDLPFGSDGHCKRSYYRIADPFLDFWYTFVQPNLSRQDFLETVEERMAFDAQYNVYLGGVWERIVRDALSRKHLPGDVRRWRNAARWWGTGIGGRPMEIDVVAESTDGDSLLVGEAKLSLSGTEAEYAVRELEAKARQLPFADKYKRIDTRLFVARNPPVGAVSIDWCESCLNIS